jgi:type I restriction enzyme R subunit
VVINPAIGFTQLADEVVRVSSDEERALVRDQFVAKLQRKKRHLSETAARDFETRAGMTPEAFIGKLRSLAPAEIAGWFTQFAGLGEILDRKGNSSSTAIWVSEHPDTLLGAERGFGNAQRPEDYLKAFAAFINSHSNDMPALLTVLTRPRELTRKQLRELALALDLAGFKEVDLALAWRQTTNQEIAARIVGIIRQAAIGDPLIPYEERVDHALQKLLSTRAWTTPQRDWLKKIAAQTKANTLVDREALDDPDLLFRTQGGGFERINRVFDGQLLQTLDAFNDAIWAQPAA